MFPVLVSFQTCVFEKGKAAVVAPHTFKLLQSHLRVAPSHQNTKDEGEQEAHGPALKDIRCAADNKDNGVAASLDPAETSQSVDHEVLLTLDSCVGLHRGGRDFFQICCPYLMAYHKEVLFGPTIFDMSTTLFLPQVTPVYNAYKKWFTLDINYTEAISNSTNCDTTSIS